MTINAGTSTSNEKDTTEVCMRGFVDKTHPSADWSGYVPPSVGRKHFHTSLDKNVDLSTSSLSKALCENLTSGLQTTAGANSRELSIPRRKRSTVTQSFAPDLVTGESKGSLLGGITPVDDPDRYASKRWMSENRKQMETCTQKNETGNDNKLKDPNWMMSSATDLDQLTERGRRSFIRGKKEISRDVKEFIPPKQNSNQPDEKLNMNAPSSLIGCRSNFSKNKSLLSNLGKRIVQDTGLVNGTCYVPCAPYATEKNLPTDPYYQPEQGSRQKDLLEENVKGVIPGYTGKSYARTH